MSLILILSLGCSDHDFLDKTVMANSLIRGENVELNSDLAKKVVLITQELEVKKDSVQFFGLCSGAVIGPRAILTAAHCLNNFTGKMRVILNTNPRFKLNEKKDVYQVVDQVIHPDYKKLEENLMTLEEKKENSDLAVLYLDRDIESSEISMLAADSDLKKVENFFNLTLTGFGRTTALKDTSNVQLAELNGQLKKANLSISPNQLKAKYFDVKQFKTAGICYGDSGAPVFVEIEKKSYLFAVAVGVFRIHDAEEKILDQNQFTDCAGSGVYVNLQNYTDWIKETVTSIERRN